MTETNYKTYQMPSDAKIELSGKVYVGDPCYVINDSDWDHVCDLMINEDFDDRNKLRVFEINNVKSYWFGTAYGDGCYSLLENKFPIPIAMLGVDAGLLSLIPVEILKETNPNFDLSKVEKFGHIIDVDKSMLYSLNNGNLEFGPYFIDTAGLYDDDIDDEYDDDIDDE
jgi:hypothetical protein